MKKVHKLELIIILSCLTGLNILSFAGSPADHAKRMKGLPYLSLSAGAGIWSMPLQEGMGKRFIPYSVLLEYGRTSYPLSIIAGIFFHSTYNLDYFLLNPNYLLLGMQYAPLKGKRISKKINAYVTGGLNLSYSRFTEELYPGIINYENKVEKKTGAGLGAGLGMGYHLKSLEIKSMLFYFTGQADFLAGHFTPQKFNTGSLQLHLMLSYRFIFKNNTCPAYKNFNSLHL